VQQEQFLKVLDRDAAEQRFRAVLDLHPLEAETVLLQQAWQRILAGDIKAPIDVPGFDRSNVDGFAIQAADSFGATEDQPVHLRLDSSVITPGIVPTRTVAAGTATAIATGGMLPRGADAVAMVENTDTDGTTLIVRRPVTPGTNITFAGTDIGRGETVLRRGELLTSRETGVLAALGVDAVPVVRRPRVAIISTGDELVTAGQPLRTGQVYDSNAVILADAVRELGGEPVLLGIVTDNKELLRNKLEQAVAHDVVVLSGGTSKGEGDLCYRVVGDLGEPGIVVHGVALKPGKPLCLAAVHRERRTVPVVILPGFPTSAIFTFHEFVAPVIRRLAGREEDQRAQIAARLPVRVNSERGRTEYLLVGLVENLPGQSPRYSAYPMGKGSGSVTTFSRADGFVIIPRQQEYLEANSVITVQLLDRNLRAADLVVIGSHCVGLDYLLGLLRERGVRSKFLAVGSTGGLEAVRRGECDLAGIHLFDPGTQTYNQSFLTPGLRLLPGYCRLQGIVYRSGDPRMEGQTAEVAVQRALADPGCVLVNRNRGSGTRVLIDRLLAGARPLGYQTEVRSHNAVVAAVAQGRADWGVGIATVATGSGLGFLPLQAEHFDFAVPESRWQRPAVQLFAQLLHETAVRESLSQMGFPVE
jgi:putative molybdopterin biosynthesis protein